MARFSSRAVSISSWARIHINSFSFFVMLRTSLFLPLLYYLHLRLSIHFYAQLYCILLLHVV